jgi:phosphatidylserine decarboxylase
MNIKTQIVIFIFRIIPKSLISRLFGYLTMIPLPRTAMRPLINWYCGKYGVNRSEFDEPESGFRNFNSFFTRQLKDGVRPLDSDPMAVLSPVDARVDQFGAIDDRAIIQAKGIYYSVDDLIPSASAVNFIRGSFITLYLSPGDYHRIHSPVNGRITGYFNIPGRLYTVQEFMVKGLRGLFSINERLITFIRNPSGRVAVCKVGAMNVGRISLSYKPVMTNGAFRSRKEVIFSQGERVPVNAGEEIGVFHLGSTVILLFERDMISFEKLKTGDRVRYGQRIGTIISQPSQT